MMRIVCGLLLAAGLLIVGVSASAQPPPGKEKGGKGKEGKGKGRGPQAPTEDLLTRLMAFDKNKDGKLTKEELGDERLDRLFDRADTNKDGFVTKEELEALAAKEAVTGGRGGPGSGPGGGRGGPGGGPGGPGDGPPGPGGFGPPPGGPGGPPQPGQILPPFLRDELGLTGAQKQKLGDLQKDVDAKLAEILTEAQRQQLQEMGRRGPGGRAGPEVSGRRRRTTESPKRRARSFTRPGSPFRNSWGQVCNLSDLDPGGRWGRARDA